MPKVPIYTSKVPLRRTPMVVPQPDIAVSEAIGGLAETTGKIAMDWASAKAEDTAQRELASATLNYKSKMSDYVNSVRDDPNYNKEWESDFNKIEQEIRGGIEFTTQEAKTVAERNFGNYKLAAENDLAGIDRQKHISAGKIQLNTDLDLAVKMGDKGEVKKLLESANLILSGPAREAEGITREHDIEVGQIKKALAVDIKTSLDDFKLVTQEEKNELINDRKDSVRAEENTKKTIQQDELKKQQAQLGKDNIEELHNNTLTWNKLVDQKSILTEQQFKSFEHALMAKSPENSDPKVRAKLWKRLGLGLLTSTDIMNAYGDLNIPDKKALESAYTTREKNEWGMMIEPNKYQQATKEVDVTLNELVEDELMSKGEMEEARTNIINRLFDVSKKKNLVDDEILEQKEKLMLPYYKKQLPLLNDHRAWNDFMLGRQKESETERGIAEIKIKELEEKVKKEKLSESGKIRVIAPDGREGYIPKTQIEEAKKAGYKVVE